MVQGLFIIKTTLLVITVTKVRRKTFRKNVFQLIIIIIFVSSDTASGGEESPLLYLYIRTKPYNVKPYM